MTRQQERRRQQPTPPSAKALAEAETNKARPRRRLPESWWEPGVGELMAEYLRRQKEARQ